MKSLFLSLFFFSLLANSADIKVDGRRGQDAPNGSGGGSGSSGAWGWSWANNGGDGGHGTHAGQSTEGQNAGSIRVHLRSTDAGTVEMTGGAITPNGENQKIEQRIKTESGERVHLSADGGKGGDGGAGGNGGSGGNGGRGSDATEASPGGNGGTGGRGGDGGNGSRGSDGGDGGKIIVSVNANDLDLTRLVSHSEYAGSGGRAGSNGSGGSGGSGGWGGSSYYRSYDCYCNTHTDSNGFTSTSCQTCSVSQSGGWNGSSGNSGRSGNGDTSAGGNGKQGSFHFKVIDKEAGEPRLYPSAFALQVQGYDVETDRNAGIVEPGERLTVKNLTVRNTGGAPTPSGAQLKITLTGSNHLNFEPGDLRLPRALAPGESYTFPEEALSFRVKNKLPFSAGEIAPKWNASFAPLETLPRLGMTLPEAGGQRGVLVEYPITVETLVEANQGASGTEIPLMLKLTNKSDRNFGESTDDKRHLEVNFNQAEVKVNGAKYKIILDKEEADSINRNIQNLKAGETILLRGKVRISEDAVPYTSGAMKTKLKQQTLDGEVLETQVQDRQFRVSQVYRNNPNNKYVFIANSDTNFDQVAGWNKVAKKLGSGLDIWDAAHYKHFNMLEKLESDSTLMKDFSGKTVIVSTNPYMDSNKNRVDPISFLKKEEFTRAAAAHNVNFLFVNPTDGQVRTLNAMSETRSRKKEEIFPTSNAYMEFAKKDLASGDNDYTDINSTVKVNKFVFFGSDDSKVEKIEKKLQKELDTLYPERKYLVSHTTNPDANRWFKTQHLGDLQVMRALDRDNNAGVVLATSDRALQTGAFASERNTYLRALTAMDFREKLLALQSPATKKELLTVIADAILSDLAREQMNLRKGALSGAEFAEKMKLLKTIKDFQWNEQAKKDPEIQAALKRIAGAISFTTSEKFSMWSTGFRLSRRFKRINAQTLSMLEEFTKNSLGKKIKELSADLKSEETRLAKGLDASEVGFSLRVLDLLQSGQSNSGEKEQVCF